jgi:hypothetical protein
VPAHGSLARAGLGFCEGAVGKAIDRFAEIEWAAMGSPFF